VLLLLLLLIKELLGGLRPLWPLELWLLQEFAGICCLGDHHTLQPNAISQPLTCTDMAAKLLRTCR
jgi:hypothetical protein